MKIKTSGSVKGIVKPQSNIAKTVLIGIGVVLLSGAIYLGLSNVLATESYYVLASDVPAKTQITSKMLKEITTAKGTAPQNAITLAQINQSAIFTKYPLQAGDIVSASNTGLNLDSSTGIPDDWVITSFNISTDDAVGGNISKGDYFDVIGINSDSGAKYIFHNVLALEANFQAGENTVNAEGKVVQLGETVQYIVGMPADKAAILQHTLTKFEKVKLVLSPNSLKYKDRNVKDLTNSFVANNELEPADLFEGTDNSFSTVLRDENGRPVTIENCAAGVISPNSLCAEIKTQENKPEDSNKEGESQ